MKAYNGTKAVINYAGRAYAPGAAIEIDDAHAKRRDIVRMLGDGRLTVRMAEPETAKAAPSAGLKVDDLKAELTKRGIAIPDGAKKEDLAKLLDDAAS